jgi:hypothetical protein
MSHSRRTLVTAVLTLAGLAALAPAGDQTAPIVRPGQSPAEVRDRLGPPARITRQVLFRRVVEQWVYDGSRPARIEFATARGREPSVSAVLPAPPLRP